MASLKLTDGLVEALSPGERDVYAWDTELRRFGVRMTTAGARIYLVQYRPKVATTEKPKTRRITIGQHNGDHNGGVLDTTKARAAARKLLARVDLGGDPFAEDQAERQSKFDAKLAAAEAEAARLREEERRETETVEAQVDLYVERRLGKRRSAGEAARLLRHGPVAAWRARHVSAVRRSDVADLLETISQRSGAVARATYAELRPFFDWCVERELIVVSPCANVTAPPRPISRDRVLADSELALIWRAADRIGFPFGPVFKLLMLTGQRRAEVAGMAWRELDLKAGTWRIPAERVKNKQAHEIDLSPEALEVLEALPKFGPLVFPARGGGAVRGFSATKRKLDAVIENLRREDATETGDDPPEKSLPDWRIHDLRRTAATGMAALAFPPHVVERVLNHVSGAQSGLVGVYQRHEYRQERKAALTAWGACVAALLAGRPLPSNVTRIRA